MSSSKDMRPKYSQGWKEIKKANSKVTNHDALMLAGLFLFTAHVLTLFLFSL